jgi:O-antigen ligase
MITIGVGVNGYPRVYDRYDKSDGAFGRARSVHSAWFGIVAELGIVGLLLFAAVIFLAWRSCVRARRLAAAGLVATELGAFGAGLEMSLMVFAVGGSFVIFQYTEMLWHVVGLTMALHFLTEHAVAAAPAMVPVWTPPRRIAV